jgi:polyhydroxybutyrate depolymerase
MRLSDLYFSWWLRPGTTCFITAGGVKRSYIVHLPNGHDPQTPMPVVLALHGATMNAAMMAWFSGLNRKADEAGFIVVYPNGTGRRSSFTWNAGKYGSVLENNADDVGFINALLDDVLRSYPVDVQRIYATGMSNGAVMVYRLACELPDRIAAIAPVAGSMLMEVCQPKRPVSVLHFHGTQDEYVPFQGGIGKRSILGTKVRPVEHSIQTWVKLDVCNEKPVIDVLSQKGDEMTVTRTSYKGGIDGTEVTMVVIEGGGHTWPGMRTPARVLGKSATNVSANDLMWEFFQGHSLPKK